MKNLILATLVLLAVSINSISYATGETPANNSSPAMGKSSLNGKVVDNKTGEALVGVTVQIEGTEYKAYTDLDGNFTFNNINPGNYNLVLSLISYKSSLIEELKLKPASQEIIDIKLDAVR